MKTKTKVIWNRIKKYLSLHRVPKQHYRQGMVISFLKKKEIKSEDTILDYYMGLSKFKKLKLELMAAKYYGKNLRNMY